MFGNHEGFFWGGGFMWLFWILLILVIVLIVKALANNTNRSEKPDKEQAQDILRKRYARGEIDEEEYERRSKELDN